MSWYLGCADVVPVACAVAIGGGGGGGGVVSCAAIGVCGRGGGVGGRGGRRGPAEVFEEVGEAGGVHMDVCGGGVFGLGG